MRARRNSKAQRIETQGSGVGRSRIRLIGIIGLGVVLSILSLTGVDRPREGIFDVYQRLMPQSSDRFYARIVEIDEASLTKFGSWPWPRFLLADLAQEISRRGALAIGFDIIFPEPDRYGVSRFLEIYTELPEHLREGLVALRDPDSIFARTIGRLPVALGRAGVLDRRNAGARDPSELYIEPEMAGDPVPETLLSFPAAVANIELLDGSAAGHGPGDPIVSRDRISGISRRTSATVVACWRTAGNRWRRSPFCGVLRYVVLAPQRCARGDSGLLDN